MKKERDAVKTPDQMDRCDDCGKTIGHPNRTEYRHTVDGWQTVGCCYAHAESAARARWGGPTPLGVWRGC